MNKKIVCTFLRGRSRCPNGESNNNSENYLHFCEKSFSCASSFVRSWVSSQSNDFVFVYLNVNAFLRNERKRCICLSGSCRCSDARTRSDHNIRRPNTDTHTHAYDPTQRNKQTNMHSGQMLTLRASKYPRQLFQFHQKQRFSDIGSRSTCLKMM